MSGRRAVDTVVLARGLALPGASPGARLDFEIFPGEVFAVVGGEHAGKTQLIEVLAGISPAAASELTILGAAAGHSGGRVGALVKDTAFERRLTVTEAMRLFASFAHPPVRIDEALDLMDLRDVAHAKVETLSRAWRQRLLLTLALMRDPLLLIADDPTCDLDLDGWRRFRDLLHRRRERGRTSVFSTDRVDEAERIADRVAVMKDGRLLAVDAPDRLVAASKAPARIVFELPRPVIGPETLSGIDGAFDVHVSRERYTVQSHDIFRSLRGLIRAFEAAQVTPSTLTVRRPTLEDAVVELTAFA